MKKAGVLPAAVCASLAFHAVLFLFLSFHAASRAGEQVLKETPVFSLINVALIEDAVIKNDRPSALVPAARQPQAETVLAENYITINGENEHVEDVMAAQNESVQNEGVHSERGQNEGVRPEHAMTGISRAADRERAAAYVKKNFSYIQRRIRDKLIYPEEARKANMQGVTEAVFTLYPDGSVSGVAVLVSSGQRLLDEAALAAIQAAAPFFSASSPKGSRQGGLAIPVRISIPVAFKLK
jgi:protein TonB